MARRTWKGLLAPLGKPTGDSRIIKTDAKIQFREFPLPLSWQKTSSEGHLQSVVIGGITTASVDGQEIRAQGFLLDTPEAAEAKELIEEGLIRPSLDPSDVVWELVDEDGQPIDIAQMEAAWENGEEIRVLDAFSEMTVMGATLVSTPAFAEAIIELDPEADPDADGEGIPEEDEEIAEAEAALIASIGAEITRKGFYVQDPSVFEDPKLDRVTGLHIRDDGRVVGHVARWGQCHIGSPEGTCTTAPASTSGYAYFHQTEVGTPTGPMAVGKLTVGGGHADRKLSYLKAMEHYDEVGATFAMGRVGEDAHGIWFSGIVHPAATDLQIAEGLSSPISGDWRRIGGKFEMVAVCSVNVGGFPTPRGYRDESGRDVSLVAAGVVLPEERKAGSGRPVSELIAEAATLAARTAVSEYARTTQTQARVDALAARVRQRRLAKYESLANRLRGVNA